MPAGLAESTVGRVLSLLVTTTRHLDAIHRVGKALADPTRSRILLALLDGTSYPADLVQVLALSKQSVSNHLACLRDCGIVVTEPEGRRVRYEIADPRLRHALLDLLGVVLAVDDDAGCHAGAIMLGGIDGAVACCEVA